MAMLVYRTGVACCSRTSSRSHRRGRPWVVAATSFSDDFYKYSDDVVYTEQFANAVRGLNRVWNLSVVDRRELRPILVDGRWLLDLVEKKFGMRYECGLHVAGDGISGDQAVCLYIGPYVFDGRDYEGYVLRMTGIVRRLAEIGVDAIEIENRIAAIDVLGDGEICARGDGGEWIVGF